MTTHHRAYSKLTQFIFFNIFFFLTVTVVAGNRVVLDDAYEENDTLNDAYNISAYNGIWLSTVGGQGVMLDDDWYEISVGDGLLEIDLTFSNMEGDIDLYLHDAAGGQLAASEGIVDNEHISFGVLTGTGTYYIRVSAFPAATGNLYDLMWAGACPDTDVDGVCDSDDLCIGDDASGDGDIDGYCADTDCHDGDRMVNPGAVDILGDGIDTNCDGVDGDISDRDGDGVNNEDDNCPDNYNRSQLDADADGTGNVCDQANHIACGGDLVTLPTPFNVDRNVYCAAETSIETRGNNSVLLTGLFVMSAPAVTFSPSFRVEEGGILEVGPNQIAPCIQMEFYPDSDGDTYGDSTAQSLLACPDDIPPGYVDNALDCDDGSSSVNPAATELCDGVDNNCDAQIDDSCVASSCAAALNAGLTATGIYLLDPDGLGGGAPFPAWCEQSFDGGGWLAVYNFMRAPENNTGAAQMWNSINNRSVMSSAVLPNSTSNSIYTQNVDLSNYTEVLFGWAASASDAVTHYGRHTNPSGLANTCFLGQLCSNGGLVGSFEIQPTGNTRDIFTGNSPTYPHVGLGFSGQSILWGYDNNASAYSHWGNWYDENPCCNSGNDASILTTDPWRYVIYVR